MKYVVTETAPSRVAGRRVRAGDTIELTDKAALYERSALHILPVEEPSKSAEAAVEPASKATKVKS